MAKVVIAFNRDPDKVGKTIDVDDVEAATLVREGRARYVDASAGTRVTANRKASKADAGS